MAQLLINMLLTRKKEIHEKWVNLIFDDYQSEGAKFFREHKDPFINPVGGIISKDTMVLYDQLLGTMDTAAINQSLDNIIKIRAIQELSPVEAVAFLYQLKEVIIGELDDGDFVKATTADLIEIFDRIDRLTKIAFEIYMNNREKINQIRIHEMKKRFALIDINKVPKAKN